MTPYVQIGSRRYPLELSRGYSPVTGKNDGRAHRFRAILATKGQAYAYAEVQVIHEFHCPATRMGKGHGPCGCGGEELFRSLLDAVGESYDGTFPFHSTPAPATAPTEDGP